MRYDLPKNFFIKNIDCNNWGLVRTTVSKDGKETESIKGYYPTLAAAFRGAMNKLSLKCSNNRDLIETLTVMKFIIQEINQVEDGLQAEEKE